jgi:fructose-1,6-bisphosphatase/inositol monophosphatase family enzyme
MILNFEPQQVAAIIRNTAAMDILPFFRKLRENQISNKDSGEIVTEADMRAEKRLTRQLLALLPGSVAIGEEAVDADPTIEERLLGKEPVWVIDPVDGTRNFASGKECFCVIVAFCIGGQTIAGWIYDPISEVMYFAELEKGAWANNRRLIMPPPPGQNKMIASLGKIRQKNLERHLSSSERPKKIVRYRCIGREYTDMSLGKIHFGEYAMLKPWDHAAGLLIISEAGGYHAYTETQYSYEPVPTIRKSLLVTTSHSQWLKLRELFI